MFNYEATKITILLDIDFISNQRKVSTIEYFQEYFTSQSSTLKIMKIISASSPTNLCRTSDWFVSLTLHSQATSPKHFSLSLVCSVIVICVNKIFTMIEYSRCRRNMNLIAELIFYVRSHSVSVINLEVNRRFCGGERTLRLKRKTFYLETSFPGLCALNRSWKWSMEDASTRKINLRFNALQLIFRIDIIGKT